jgi:MinD superfamily P-loop ATPase
LSGIHDLERVTGVAGHFGIEVACLVNKCDINLENSERIEEWCRSRQIPVIGRIRYDPMVVEAVVQRRTFVEHAECGATNDLKDAWRVLAELRGLRRN